MLKAIVVIGSLLVGGAALAQPEMKPEMKKDRTEMKQKMLAKFDTNKDGKLDKAERVVMRQQRATQLFKKLDTDGNGQLSFEEFKQGKQFGKRHFGARRGFRHGANSR